MDDFRDVILDELKLAKAVIVIWSESSVRSKFVRDEADRADKNDKLIATCMAGFDLQSLPLGFGGRHCHSVEELQRTLKALVASRRSSRGAKTSSRAEDAARRGGGLGKDKSSQNWEDFVNYIRTYTNGLYRAPAVIYLRKLDLLNNPNVRALGRVTYQGTSILRTDTLYMMAVVLVFLILQGVLRLLIVK